jgi:hypothetical protein
LIAQASLVFDRWGRFLNRFRWATLACGVLDLVWDEVPQVAGCGSKFILLFSNPDLTAKSAAAEDHRQSAGESARIG